MEQDIELLERYLNGDLHSNEKEEVEERLKSDPTFADRMKILQDSKAAILNPVDDFRNELRQVINEQEQGALVEEKRPFNWRYGIAAALFAIALTFAAYLIMLKPPTADALYADNFNIPPENITVRDQPGDDLLSEALDAYNQDNYQEALGLFQEFLQEDPQHQGVMFYSGICQLVLDQNEQALVTFQNISTQQTGEYLTAAQWYLGLTYLKLDHLDQAKATLGDLHRAGNGNYSRDAGILLEKIK